MDTTLLVCLARLIAIKILTFLAFFAAPRLVHVDNALFGMRLATSQPRSRLEPVTLGPIVTPTVTGRIALLHRSVYRSQRRTIAVSGVAFANATADTPDNKKARMTGSDTTTRVVVWFRNDLRLQDNYAVKQAESIATRTAGCDVLPLYVFDPRTFAPSSWGSPKCGGHRGRFQLESVLNLKRNLRAIGSDLLVAVGKPEEVIPKYLLDAPGAKNVVLTQVSELLAWILSPSCGPPLFFSRARL